MDFSTHGRSSKSLTGISIAIVGHLIFGYALVSGLAHKVVDVLKKPLETTIIQELQPPPPPPPPQKKVEIPKADIPPPAYVPPQVNVPPPPAPTAIAAVTQTPPPPAPPPQVVEAPPAPKPPPAIAVGIACPNHVDVRSRVAYPQQAQLRGLNGDVTVEFTVGPSGAISDARVIKSSSPIFNDAALSAINQLRCIGQGQDVKVRIPFAFRLDN